MPNENVDELLEITKKFEDRYEEIWNKISKKVNDDPNFIYKSEYSELKDSLYKLVDEQEEIEEKIRVNRKADIEGEKIDLRKCDNYGQVNGYYFICLHGKSEKIGTINYIAYHASYIGDVGLSIREDYRGNGYGYEALCLLGEILYKNNISDFWVAIYKDNIPSIRNVEKYGGIPFKEERGIVYYECKTFCRKDKNIEK